MASIALIGPDGAGKTSVSNMLQQRSPVPLKCLYMGINIKSSRVALPTSRLAELLKARSTGRASVDTNRRAGTQRSRGSLRSMARLVNRVADEWYRQFVSWYYQLRGYTVLYDRHFLYDFATYGPKTPDRPKLSARLHRALLRALYPRPDLVIYLDAPAEVLFARKGEGTVEELEWRRQAFLQIGESDPSFVRIDATRPFEEVCADVSNQLLRFRKQVRPTTQEA